MYDNIFISNAWIGIAFIALLVYTHSLFKKNNYRKLMTDLYIVGKVKQYAQKEGIDLAVEYECYKKFIKKQRINNQPLDDTIEREMQEEISEEFAKKNAKKEQKEDKK